MALRSLTGISYQQKLGVGFYGEVFQGHDRGQAVRIVHVDPELAELPGFAGELEQVVEGFAPLEDPRVVIARRVGREDGKLVVVTDHVKGPVTLEALLRRGRLPTDIAVAIGFGLIQGIAYAHSLKTIHGGVHPRSVLLDFHGSVRVADFALASALARLGDNAGAKMAAGLAGYLAPEVRVGARPNVASDIYAAGAVMIELLTGRPPPGSMDAPPALIEVMLRATAAEPRERHLNGTELEEDLDDATVRDGQRVALDRDVAGYVTDQLAKGDVDEPEDLDAGTDDLLAEMGLAPEPVGKPKTKPAGKATEQVAVVPPARGTTTPPPPSKEPIPPPAPASAEQAATPGLPRKRAMSDVLADLEEETGEDGVPDIEDPALVAEVVKAQTGQFKLPPLPKPKTRPGFEYRSASDTEAEQPEPPKAAPSAPKVASSAPKVAPPSSPPRDKTSQGLGKLPPIPAIPKPALNKTTPTEIVPSDDDDDVGFDDLSTSGDHTAVEDPDRIRELVEEADPISKIVKAPDPVQQNLVDDEDEDTPLPEPAAHHLKPGELTMQLEAAPDDGSEESPLAKPAPAGETKADDAMDAVFSLDDVDGIDSIGTPGGPFSTAFADDEPEPDEEPETKPGKLSVADGPPSADYVDPPSYSGNLGAAALEAEAAAAMAALDGLEDAEVPRRTGTDAYAPTKRAIDKLDEIPEVPPHRAPSPRKPSPPPRRPSPPPRRPSPPPRRPSPPPRRPSPPPRRPSPEPEPEPAYTAPAAPKPAVAAPAAPILPEPVLPPESLKKNHNLLWAALSVFVLASLFGILYTQTDIFQKDRAEALDEMEQRRREREQKRLEDEQVKPGEIVVDASQPEAAVWLLLGRTPVDSFALPAGRVHELRLEHEGYHPLDLPVTAVHWTKKDGELRAEVRGKLVPGTPTKPIPPYPPEPEVPRAAGAEGRGVVHIESTPSGAQVWMLIGFTPETRLTGIPAGHDYEFKLLKKGFRPGFAVVRTDDWYLSGPGSPVRSSLSRSVELAPIAEGKPKKRKKRR